MKKLLILFIVMFFVWQSSSKSEINHPATKKKPGKSETITDNLRFVSEQLESLKIVNERKPIFGKVEK